MAGCPLDELIFLVNIAKCPLKWGFLPAVFLSVASNFSKKNIVPVLKLTGECFLNNSTKLIY